MAVNSGPPHRAKGLNRLDDLSEGTSMHKAVLSAGVALILLSQSATAQVNPAVEVALTQANAALGQANAILEHFPLRLHRILPRRSSWRIRLA